MLLKAAAIASKLSGAVITQNLWKTKNQKLSTPYKISMSVRFTVTSPISIYFLFRFRLRVNIDRNNIDRIEKKNSVFKCLILSNETTYITMHIVSSLIYNRLIKYIALFYLEQC